MRFINLILTIILTLFVCTNLFTQSDCWEWQNPLPHGNTFSDIFFIDENVGWRVGGRGIIDKTIDGGITWVDQFDENYDSFSSVHFSDALNGWVVSAKTNGVEVIYKTNDGGETWLSVNTGLGPNFPREVFVQSPDSVWIVGNAGIIHATSDGGMTWVKQDYGDTYTLNSVQFIDEMVGYVVGNGGQVLKTENGGAAWVVLDDVFVEDYNALYFLNKQEGWIAGDHGTILKTINGGESWDLQANQISSVSLYGLHFFNEQIGWVTGSINSIWKTTDGGVTWNNTSNIGTAFGKCFFVSENKGWVVDYRSNVYWTNDGGNTWLNDNQIDFKRIYDIDFFDSHHGIGVEEDGRIFRTIDGGENWIEQPSPTDKILHSVQIVDQDIIWACGQDGTIIHSQDSGETWTLIEFGDDDDFLKILFISEEKGWAFGEDGIVYKTENGGIMWELQPSFTDKHIRNAFFVNQDTGWVVGDGAIIFNTVDGGVSWSAQFQPTGSLPGFYGIYFHNSQEGWITGAWGRLLKTGDGGATWENVDIGAYTLLRDIQFSDSLHAWIGEASGTIFESNDGGVTWERFYTPTHRSIYSVFPLQEGIVWIAGGNGSILRKGIINPTINTEYTCDSSLVGSFTHLITNQLGCDSLTINQVKWAPVELTDSVILADNGQGNGSIELLYPLSQSYSFAWSNGDTTSYIQNLTHGNYEVTITSIANCEVVYSFQVPLETNIEHKKLSDYEMKIYPNPLRSEMLNIEVNLPGFYSLNVYDIHSKLVFKEDFYISNEEHQFKMPFKFQSGVYAIEVITEERRTIHLLVKLD